jgi:hypothetical protein
VAVVVAQFQDAPRDAIPEERMVPRLGSGTRGWMDVVVARVPGPLVAVPVDHTAGLVGHSEVRVESGGRAAPYPTQSAASFFAVHAAARHVASEEPVALPGRFVSAEAESGLLAVSSEDAPVEAAVAAPEVQQVLVVRLLVARAQPLEAGALSAPQAVAAVAALVVQRLVQQPLVPLLVVFLRSSVLLLPR